MKQGKANKISIFSHEEQPSLY